MLPKLSAFGILLISASSFTGAYLTNQINFQDKAHKLSLNRLFSAA